MLSDSGKTQAMQSDGHTCVPIEYYDEILVSVGHFEIIDLASQALVQNLLRFGYIGIETIRIDGHKLQRLRIDVETAMCGVGPEVVDRALNSILGQEVTQNNPCCLDCVLKRGGLAGA